MGAITNEVKFANEYEALDAKFKNALFTLSCRALAEPFNFYRIDGEFSTAMLHYERGTIEAAIMAECQKQFRQSGRYSPQTVLAEIPGAGNDIISRTAQDVEIDLPMAFDFFRDILGRMVEKENSLSFVGRLSQNLSSEEIQTASAKLRRERGYLARQTGSDGIADFEAELCAALEGKTFDYPVKPHLASLRKLIPSFEPGDYGVITALTGIGKTYFALNMVYHNALAGVPCSIINLENTPKNIIRRVWQMHGESRFQKNLECDDAQTLKHLKAWEEVKKMPFRSHNPGRSLPAILSTIRHEWNERGIQFAIVDYAQLISVPEYRGNRNYELGEVSAEFRALALDLQIPIFVLAQLKQEVTKTGDRRGGIYDIKDCANFAQDATFVMSLYRPSEVDVLTDSEGVPYPDNYADITIVKGRETGRAQAKCFFDPIRGFYETSPNFNPALPGGVLNNRNEEYLPF